VGLQVTELNFDATYDCKRVLAGPDTGKTVAEAFYALGERIAEALHLSGIMDIEVIDHNGELKVLEIDARLPSQTPSAVYHSTGANIVELLADYWIHGRLPSWRRFSGKQRAVIYEHLRFHNKVLEVSGEHVLADAQDLKVYHDKFSADVLISNFEKSPDDWVATAIFVDETETLVWGVRNRAISIIQQAFKAEKVLDPEPFD
jgi:pyrrolysine biosynthesis protein PylC